MRHWAFVNRVIREEYLVLIILSLLIARTGALALAASARADQRPLFCVIIAIRARVVPLNPSRLSFLNLFHLRGRILGQTRPCRRHRPSAWAAVVVGETGTRAPHFRVVGRLAIKCPRAPRPPAGSVWDLSRPGPRIGHANNRTAGARQPGGLGLGSRSLRTAHR